MTEPVVHRSTGLGGQIRSIRFRIVAAFLAALIAMMGAQGFLIWQQQRVTASLSLVTEGYLPLSELIADIERDWQLVENDARRLLREERRPSTGRVSPIVLYAEKVGENLAIGRIIASGLQKRGELSPEEQAIFHKVIIHVDRIEELFDTYQKNSAAVVRLAEAGLTADAAELGAPLEVVGTEIAEEIDKLRRLLDGRIEELTRATREAQTRATAIAAGLTTIALVFSVGLIGAVLFALGPIGRLTTEVQRLAAGDYGGRVEVSGVDEVAILAAEFNAMVLAIEHRDRTLVERAEELDRLSTYLTSVLDSLGEGLIVVEDGTVTLTNPAATRVWGTRSTAPPPPALAELIGEETVMRHEVGGPEDTLQDVRITPFGAHGVVVVSADITTQTRAKEQLARSERLALIGQMLAQITHEVRNPLNALSLNAELLGDELTDLDPKKHTEAWDILATITSEIERLTAVTGHYLQLARRSPAQLAPADPLAVAEDVARLIRAELAQEGVVLTVESAGTLDRQLFDENQLRQAFLNIFRNAVEAGARTVRVVLAVDEDELQITIYDDGPGMTNEQVQRAWDPFFSTKTTGTGLGLAIVKQIVEDHGGEVRVTTAVGEGTQMVLALPYRPAELDPSGTETAHVADHPRR